MDEVVWPPLSSWDYVVLAVLGAYSVLTLCGVAHLAWCRLWPPYVTKIPTLFCAAGVGTVFWASALTLVYGFWEREEDDFLANCDVETLLSWGSLGLICCSVFIRFLRLYNLLIRHDGHQWSTESQMIVLFFPYLVPSVVHATVPAQEKVFNPVTNECEDPGTVTLYMNGFITLLLFTGFYMACRMRHVRRQLLEYKRAVAMLSAALVVLVSFPVVGGIIGEDDLALRRRVVVLYPVLVGAVLFWFVPFPSMVKYITQDEEYLKTFTHGFSTLPTPSQLRASLAEKLTVDELREEFRKYAETRVAQELVDFYKDCLDRDEILDYFERQAATMRIVDTYVREGSPSEINISDACRKRILDSDITSFDIFDEASVEVIKIMETNFEREFEKTAAFQQMRAAAEAEERELQLLGKEQLVPTLGGTLPGPPQRPYRKGFAVADPAVAAAVGPGLGGLGAGIEEKAGTVAP